MTKKTNSCLFRLGTSSLWKNKSPNFYKFINDIRLEKILYNELNKRKLSILAINWKSKTTQILTYDSLNSSVSFKQEIFQYYKKTRNAIKLMEFYSIHKPLVLRILIDKRFYVQKSIANNGIRFYLFVYFLIKFYELQHITKMLFIIKNFQWVQLTLILKSFNLLSTVNNSYLYRQNKTNKLLQVGLKKIFSVCFFKVLSIFLENIIFYTKKRCISISISSIWNKKGLIFQYFARDFFTFQLLTLASVYNNSRILSEFISSQLEKDKNHRRLLRRIILSIEKFWASYNFGFNGIQLRVTGKLNGRMRKSKYQYILGKVSLQTLQTVISYTMTVAYTKFGLISTKLWLFYGIKKI